jgi:hypothetical protein
MTVFQFVGEIEIDFKAERARIHKCFRGKVKARQLELIRLFQLAQFREWEQLYYKLPYNRASGCSEREFIGLVFHQVLALQLSKFNVIKSSIVHK